jgi:hypothetical protein
MVEQGSKPEPSEQDHNKERDERLAALSAALLQRGALKDKPDMLFDLGLDKVEQGEADAAATVAGIDARNQGKVAERNAERAAARATALEGKTSQERLALRARWMEEDVQKGDDEINANQSPDREDETGKLVGTKSKVDVADQVEAARLSVEQAAALGPEAVAQAQKAELIAEAQRRSGEIRDSGVLPLSPAEAALKEARDKIAAGEADKAKWQAITDRAKGETAEEDARDQ